MLKRGPSTESSVFMDLPRMIYGAAQIPAMGTCSHRQLSCPFTGAAARKVRTFGGSLCSVTHQGWCMKARPSRSSGGQLGGPPQPHSSQGEAKAAGQLAAPLPAAVLIPGRPQQMTDCISAPSQSQCPRGPPCRRLAHPRHLPPTPPRPPPPPSRVLPHTHHAPWACLRSSFL